MFGELFVAPTRLDFKILYEYKIFYQNYFFRMWNNYNMIFLIQLEVFIKARCYGKNE